jgi:alpha-1,3-rhamnosyl/mannosyltransferase
LKLILVGKAYLQEELPEVREIYSIIHALGIKNEVQMTGYIPDHVLIQTYKNALALIAPSYAEGFGFTVLDAMAIGCPVVCANASSLKEIAGPSLLVDPYSADSIAQAMIRIIHMNSLDRRKQIKEGRTWSNQFTWREVAKKTIDAYEKILEQK